MGIAVRGSDVREIRIGNCIEVLREVEAERERGNGDMWLW